MDTRIRTIAKTTTWQASGLLMMGMLGYIATGSLERAGGLALTSTALGTITYVLHERIWDRVPWGRENGSLRAASPCKADDPASRAGPQAPPRAPNDRRP